jgi:hypothetical protein
MAHDRDVGGIRCLEVLAALPSFLDGDVPADVHARVLCHLQGCTWCAQFGGDYAQTVARLRAILILPQSADAPASGEADEGADGGARLRRLMDALPVYSGE